MTGAMTITFIKAIKESQERKEKISYKGTMDAIHESIKQAGKSGGIFAGICRKFHQRILQVLASIISENLGLFSTILMWFFVINFQVPLLSSSEEFDTSSEFNL